MPQNFKNKLNKEKNKINSNKEKENMQDEMKIQEEVYWAWEEWEAW